MHGNGQAQNAVFPAHRTLARSAPAGYPVADTTQKSLGHRQNTASPKGIVYRTLQGPHRMSADTTPLPFTTALLLVSTEANASVDRRALRDAGITTVRVLSSGLVAARVLAGLVPNDPEPMPQVVLCHSILADMSGADFVALIRSHPQLLDIPVVALASNDDDAHKISALAGGYSALLVRPYAPSKLRTTLLEASRKASDVEYLTQASCALASGDFDTALAQYTLLTHNQTSPDLAFQEGMRQLQNRQWDHAIRSFQKAMRHISLKGESELGLATAWKGKGDMRRYKHYLSEASQTFTRALQWHKARTVYARLLSCDPKAQSPFLSMAERLIREERFDEAAEALAAGHDLQPDFDPENPAQGTTAQSVARACLCADVPSYALSKIEQSLKNTELHALAPRLSEHVRETIQGAEEQQVDRQRAAAVHSALLASIEDEITLPLPSLPPLRTKTAAQSPAKSRIHKGIALSDAAHTSPTNGSQKAEKRGAQDASYYDMDSTASTTRDSRDSRVSRASPTSRASRDQNAAGNYGYEETDQAIVPLRPMQPEDAESTLFYSIPGLNEVMSVAKFTWKLFRATKY